MAHVTKALYARYQAPDLDKMERFLIDFGLVRAARTGNALYMRASGPDHHVHITELGEASAGLGAGFEIDSFRGLEEIAKRTGSQVEECVEPGGGHKVVVRDPNGMRLDLHFGQEKLPSLPVRAPLKLNDSLVARREGQLQRPARGPSHIARMEHAVIVGPRFMESVEFYQDVLGMKISDRMYSGDQSNTVAAFMRCGLGQQYTDHHTVALAAAPDVALDHSAFVSLDWDDLMLGHHHLKAAGYEHEWGIGRHTLGSEVFDYWRDPFGNKVEHTSDSDRVNEDHVTGDTPNVSDNFYVWAPPISDSYAR